jgi:hypothetical protein
MTRAEGTGDQEMPDSAEHAISDFCRHIEQLLPHRFDVIDHLDDGTGIPVEALSEDHSIGVYREISPRKLRERQHEYVRIELHELTPIEVSSPTVAGARHEWYLECVPMRGVRFHAEWLQYLEEGWEASLESVTYPAMTAITLANALHTRYGRAFIYLNPTTPMPLWIRSTQLESADVGISAVVQVQSGGRMSPTNIHTECPMEYARQWSERARSYFDPVPNDPAAETPGRELDRA